jgi:hypothetical protein
MRVGVGGGGCGWSELGARLGCCEEQVRVVREDFDDEHDIEKAVQRHHAPACFQQAYVSIRQHTSAYVSKRQHSSPTAPRARLLPAGIRQHTQHTSA